MSGSQIAGICACVPSARMSLGDWKSLWDEKMVDSIVKVTGIEEVRLAGDSDTVSGLSLAASENLIAALNFPKSEIDAVVLATQTPDYRLPATSCILQDRLGLKTSTYCVDINYGCSGYIYAINQAAMLIETGQANNVLVCAGDVISKVLAEEDYAVRLVFGDACSATLVIRSENKIGKGIFYTDGSGYDQLIIEDGGFANLGHSSILKMNGVSVMTFAMSKVPPLVRLLEEKSGTTIDHYFFHQANKFIVNSLIKKLRIPPERAPIHVARHGNTGPASIPLTICLERLKQPLGISALVGFGVGFSWAGLTCDLSGLRSWDVIEL